MRSSEEESVCLQAAFGLKTATSTPVGISSRPAHLVNFGLASPNNHVCQSKLPFPQALRRKLVTFAMDQENSPGASSSGKLRAVTHSAVMQSPSGEAPGWWGTCHPARLPRETTETLLYSGSEAARPAL